MWHDVDRSMYLCDVWSGSGRLRDRVQTVSPSGCGWPCTGPPETHTPAAARSSRSTPSCPALWLYILHTAAARKAQRHTQCDFILMHFFTPLMLHTTAACSSILMPNEELLLEHLAFSLEGASPAESKVFAINFSHPAFILQPV